MDFSVQPDTSEISAFRTEVRDWLTENMRGSEHLRILRHRHSNTVA